MAEVAGAVAFRSLWDDRDWSIIDAKAGLFDFVVIYKVPRIMRNRDEMALLRITLRKYGVEILYSGEDIGKGSDGILQLGIKEVL
ncbi:hypothetical protein NE591_14015, partial [Adlercreutzia sp. DFI.6.23]|nr:hypothetical protein [Adlercreutzia sp. DFI.6.23]